ncbi:MAG: polysaccharide biosynthesis/export family protein [Flavobacteriales bacterium]|nr:polysaccharide biosynthesis/export family protein [Flavobacteriales bacterium]
MRTARLAPLVVLAMVVLMGGGCTINRDIMFKTPLGYQFDSVPDTVDLAFKIQPNDYLQFRLFANDGFKMIDMVSIGTGADNARNMQRLQFNYLVEPDGNVKLPLLGRVTLSGKTLREAETWLEQRYMEFYNRPFVQLSVTNRRVVVFPGGGGDAVVVPLENANTTLLEVLASARGVAKRGNAHKVKVFRRDPAGGRQVFQFDLTDIEGLKHADMVMFSDDVVYVEPNPELVREVLADITPIITLLTSVVLVIGIIRGFQ